jgi:hypothetical protein
MLLNKYFCVPDDKTNKYSYYGYNLVKSLTKNLSSNDALQSVGDDLSQATLKSKLKGILRQRTKS